MNKKHTYTFILLCLFPFLLALGFRAIDNYQFAQDRKTEQQESPNYFPKERPKASDWRMDKDICYKKKLLRHADS